MIRHVGEMLSSGNRDWGAAGVRFFDFLSGSEPCRDAMALNHLSTCVSGYLMHPMRIAFIHMEGRAGTGKVLLPQNDA